MQAIAGAGAADARDCYAIFLCDRKITPLFIELAIEAESHQGGGRGFSSRSLSRINASSAVFITGEVGDDDGRPCSDLNSALIRAGPCVRNGSYVCKSAPYYAGTDSTIPKTCREGEVLKATNDCCPIRGRGEDWTCRCRLAAFQPCLMTREKERNG